MEAQTNQPELNKYVFWCINSKCVNQCDDEHRENEMIFELSIENRNDSQYCPICDKGMSPKGELSVHHDWYEHPEKFTFFGYNNKMSVEQKRDWAVNRSRNHFKKDGKEEAIHRTRQELGNYQKNLGE